MPYLENIDELAEWLADKAGVWGSYADEEMEGHPEDCSCRLCWTIETKQRMRAAVHREDHNARL